MKDDEGRRRAGLWRLMRFGWHFLRTWRRLYVVKRRMLGRPVLAALRESGKDALWAARVKFDL